MDVGEVIPSTAGVVKYIDKVYSGTGGKDNTPWTVQNVTLSDNGSEINVAVWNREELPQTWRNKRMVLSSRPKKTGTGFVGLKRDENKKKGTPAINCANDAEIAGEDGAQTTTAPSQANSPQGKPAPGRENLAKQGFYQAVDKANNSTQHHAPSDNDGPPLDAYDNQAPAGRTQAPDAPPEDRPAPQPQINLASAKQKLNQMANLYLLCMDAADYVASENKAQTNIQMTNEHYQACVSTLFIQAEKYHIHTMVPTGKLPK